MQDRKNGESTGRNASGKFAHGNPGRPKGARNKATCAVEALLDGEAEALGRKAIQLALADDTVALRLCLERICAPRKGRPITLNLPNVGNDPARLRAIISDLLSQIADGIVSPEEAAAVLPSVESARRTIELGEMEERLSRLENALLPAKED